MFILDLFHNVAVLVALVVVYRMILSHYRRKTTIIHKLSYRLMVGGLFGAAGIIGMMTPIQFASGIIFDGRSIVLTVAGLFGGPVPAAIAALICGGYRLYLGGGGAMVGVAVIVESALFGTVFHVLSRQRAWALGAMSYWGIGVLVHAVMLVLMLGLPDDAGWTVLRQIGLPIIALYPLATMFICQLFHDYEDKERNQAELQKMVWMQEKEGEKGGAVGYFPSYGDVTELNTERTILDSVGLDLLKIMAADVMVLLDTSVAVYEKNGDYAFGIFYSKWCSLMDESSRKLCGTDDNREALACGKWLCHENCWNDSARTAMESGEPTDIECIGGIHLYAVPIRAHDEIIGVINIGYGNPPTDEETLRKLSQSFRVDIDALREAALAFKPRPSFVVDAAKSRLQSIATTIGQIVERKRSEERLRWSEKKFRAYIEGAPEGIFIVDAEGKYIEVNETACRLTGFSREELLEMTVHDLASPGTVRDTMENFSRLQGAGKLESEVLLRRKDGSDFQASLKAVAIGEGRYMGFCADIAARKQNEEAVRISEEKYRALYDNAPLAYQSLDPDGNFLDVNPAWLRILGYEREDVVGKSFSDFLHPDYRPHFETNFPAFKKRGYVDGVQFKMVRKDGEFRDVEFTGCIGYYPDGSVRQTYCVFQDITERKQAEDAVRESESRLQSLYDNMTELVVLHEILYDDSGKPVDYRILECNPAFCRMVGLSEDDAVGQLASVLYSTGEAPYLDVYARIVSTGTPEQFEIYFAPMEKHFRVSAFRTEPHRFATVTEDITERKRAEEELTSTKAILQAAMDNSPAGIAIADAPSGELRYVNTAGLMIRGGKPEQVVKGVDAAHYVASWKILDLDGIPLEEDEVPLARAVKYGETCNREFMIRRKEEDDRIVWADAAPITDAKGKVVAAIVVFLDVTERKQAEQALRESQQRLGLACGSAGLGIWDWDIVNNDMTWDDQMFRLYGIEDIPDEYGVELWEESLHPEDKDYAWKACQVALRGEKEYDIDFRIKWPDGTVRYLHGNGLVLRNEKDEPTRMIGINYDVTEQREMETKLRQMEKMDAIGQLAGGVAHDFNNQLAGIMGYSDLLRTRMDDPGLKRFAENILVASRRAGDLTKKLLAFSRQGQYQSVSVDLHGILHEVVDILQHSLDKRIDIQQILKANPSTTRGDPSQIQNALLNLAINARDAMPEGGELIFETGITELDSGYCARLPYEIEPGYYLHVSVTDNGVGIPRDSISRIFEPFYTTKEVGKGTGMGLAAVYGTVKHHGGAINVYSEEGHGTTFRVYLPLEESAAKMIKSDVAPVKATRDATILIVDDEEMIRELARDMLTDLGYRVVACEDGPSALDYYREHVSDVDLVILDMVMPKMTGKEVFQAMKAINPDIKAILSSGYSINGAAKDLFAEGVLGFVQKPFESTEFSSKVAQALQ